MKVLSQLLAIAFAVTFISCTKDSLLEDNSIQGIHATIMPYHSVGKTRIVFGQELNTLNWQDGDQIGLYHEDQTGTGSAVFEIESGGCSTGTFFNSHFLLIPNSTYYAFYPYNPTALMGAYPIDFARLVQKGNSDFEHIALNNPMRAVANTDSRGNSNVVFSNVGSIIKIDYIVPSSDKYKSITIKADKSLFTVKGTMNIKDGSILAHEKSSEITISFEKEVELQEEDVLTCYVLIVPVDMSDSQLVFTLISEAKTIKQTFDGLNFQGGKVYSFEMKTPEKETTGYLNGYKWIDLGLPSGTLWAERNVGASSEYSVGGTYAWGETYAKSIYTWSNYEFCSDGRNTKLTKYCLVPDYGNVDGKCTLDLSDDVANVLWGNGWMVPSPSQLSELELSCSWIWFGENNYEFNGIAGYKVVGPNGNCIFMPVNTDTLSGMYWSNSIKPNYNDTAMTLYLCSDDYYRDDGYRSWGGMVRPVCIK